MGSTATNYLRCSERTLMCLLVCLSLLLATGCRYLRKILIHGARAVVLRSKRDRIAMGEWMTALEARAPRNVLIVAMANKLARIAWAVLSSGQDYRAVQEPVAA